MKHIGKRVAAFLLAFLLAGTALPVQAWAAVGIPGSGAAVRYNEGFKFYERYPSGGEGFYMSPFETTTGAVMFCVDPGVGALKNTSLYSVHVGRGGTGLLNVLAECEGSSHLINAEGADGKANGSPDHPALAISPEVLAGLPADATERMIQYISVLHYYAGEGVIAAPQNGEAYNRYDVYAVQNYVWYLCNPSQTDLWYTIRPLTAGDQWNVQNAFYKIVNKANELYGNGRLAGFELADGGVSQDTAAAAQAQPLAVSDGDSRSWTAADRGAWSRIQYIAADGGAVQRFQAGDTVKQGSFAITNTGSGVSVTITGRADGTAHTAQFLTTPTRSGDDSGDWAAFAHYKTNYQSFFSVYRAPRSAEMYLSFVKRQDVELTKADADTGEGLRGAELQVLDGAGNEVARGFTEAGGKFAFPCPAPGEYTFRELAAPAGYELSEETRSFTVNADGTATGELTLPNKRTALSISKVDAATGKGLPGARVEIRDSEGNMIAQGWTDENGYFAFEQPEPGTYTFREISPPPGYKLNDKEFTFEVKEDGTIEGNLTLPNTGVPDIPRPVPNFPSFTFTQQKLDEQGGFDADQSTPVGDTSLAAGFTLTWRTDKGAGGTQRDTATLYGQGASETIFPWGKDGTPSAVVNETVETDVWDPCSELEGVEHEDGDEVEYISGYTWTGSCTVTIRESSAPAGHHGTSQTCTHTISYYAESHRDGPCEEFSPVSYSITVDGRDTGLSSDSAVEATWSSPYRANRGGADVFTDRAWVGALQIVKTQDSDDIFSEEHGQGTIAGGAVAGKEYSSNSLWTLRLVDPDGSDRFQGYESCPYVKVAEDPAMQGSGVGRLMHCYKVMLNGTGTPADSANPLTPSQFGQIYISDLPYGTYLLTEYSAGSDRYVKESMLLTIDADGRTVSASLHDTARRNVVRIVKADAETGKTVPAAGVAFRIRYLGSPEYADPSRTPNYGRYLPNAASLAAGAHSAEDYIFYTDTAGEVTIPYELPYGSYQIEELLAAEGEQPPALGCEGPDPADCPLPDGYESLADRLGPIMAYNGETDGWMVFVKEADGTYRWIACDSLGCSCRIRRQSFHLQLSQPASSDEGWRLELPGLTLSSSIAGEDMAKAAIALTVPGVEPELVSGVGSEAESRPVEGGMETAIVLRQPEAPVDFALADGTRAELTCQGGFTRTRLTVPAANAAPSITWGGRELDWLSPLTPDAPELTIALDGSDYLRAFRQEGPDGTVYTVELVSDATEDDAHRFEADLHGPYSAMPLVIGDAAGGGQRGDLRLSAVYKTMRYPLSGLVETITTDENGVARTSPLPLGSYVVRELSGPEGYVLSNAAHPFTLSHKDQFTPLVWACGTAENGAVSVQLDIAKGFQTEQGGGNYEPRAGAVFGVYACEDLPCGLSAGTLVATVASGADGKAAETLKLPRGRYYVRELATLPGYEVSGDRFLFMADDSAASGTLDFTLEDIGTFGKVTHSGYRTAEIEIATYTQLPMPELKVNGLTYDLTEGLPAGTVGDGALAENSADADRSVFTVTAAEGSPVTVTFANGAALTLEVGETGYAARLDGPISVSDGPAASLSRTAPGVWRYDPLVSHTGYTAETSAIYVPPKTALTGAGGAALAYAYGGSGVKLAVVTYPAEYRYYDDDDLPVRDVPYALGDVNLDGGVDGADLALLAAALEGESETILSEHQRTTADLDGSGGVDRADLEALAALLEALEAGEQTADGLETTAIPEPWLPDDAITFDTDGLGNKAYTGAVIDPDTHTITVDLSRFDFTENPWHVCIGGDTVTLTGVDEISLDSASAPNGLQPDGLTVSNGNTLHSRNRVLSLASYRGTHEVQAELAHDHSRMTLTVLRGSVAAAYLSGVAVAPDGPITVAPGNSVVLLMEDGAAYRAELSNTGYARLSVEDIVPGSMGGADIPLLSVDGSPDNFLSAGCAVIPQRMPMDETSLDEIRQHNSRSVTLARSDGFVRQVQVKINAASAPAGTPDGSADHTGGVTARPIENDLRPYISKADAITGRGLPGAWLEICDANGETVAAGWSDEDGRLCFDRPQPGIYTFKELAAPAGYQLNAEVFTFTVHPDGSITGDDTVPDYPIPPDPPRPDYASVAVHKVWAGGDGRPAPIASIRVQLLRNGKPYRQPVEVRGEDGWTYTWTGLPLGGVWDVEELDVPEGYTAGVERHGMSFTITNTWRDEV